MNRNNLYCINNDTKEAKEISETEFSKHGILERYDIEEWISKNPSILGEELLILAKEFNAFDKTNERADLIAIDKEGNIVIIELKRDDSGSDVHWQAIKYASYFHGVKYDQIVKIYSRYKNIDIETASSEIMQFANVDSENDVNREQRIILTSHRFALEVTSAILWLIEFGIDITCIEIVPFFNSQTHEYFISSSQIIPVNQKDEYQIKAFIGEKVITIEKMKGGKRNYDDVTKYFERILRAVEGLLEQKYWPQKTSRWSGTYYNLRYYKMWYLEIPWDNHHFSFQMHIDIEKKEEIIISFHADKEYLRNSYPDKIELLDELKMLERKDQIVDNEDVFEIKINIKERNNEQDIAICLSNLIKDVVDKIIRIVKT